MVSCMSILKKKLCLGGWGMGCSCLLWGGMIRWLGCFGSGLGSNVGDNMLCSCRFSFTRESLT